MRSALAILTLLASITTVQAVAAQGTCVKVDPGRVLGPITMGMSQTKFDTLGLSVKEGFTKGVWNVGPYMVWVGDKGVTMAGFSVEKAPCLRIAGKEVKTKGLVLEELAQRFDGCGPLQINTGANVIACGKGITLYQNLGGIEVRIETTSKAPKTVCDGYIAPGAPGSAASTIEVKPGKTYCVGTRVFTPALMASLKPESITAIEGVLRYNTCTTTVNIGATLVQCDYQGVKFVFAGPKAALARIEAIARKQ